MKTLYEAPRAQNEHQATRRVREAANRRQGCSHTGIRKSLLVMLAAGMAIACCAVATAQATAGANKTVTSGTVQQTQQNLDTKATAFEVDSVRLVPEQKSGLTSISAWGAPRFTARNATLLVLIELAFGVEENQIAGAPNWLSSQPYDVDARSAGEKRLSYEESQPMLRELLKSRFDLRAHEEVKGFAGYGLVVSKNGSKLKASEANKGQGQIVRGQIFCPGCSPQVLAGMLAHVVGFPVVDETGMKGSYEIKLDFALEDDADSPFPSIFAALQDQLGLKLEKRKLPRKVLVIDHINRVPTDN